MRKSKIIFVSLFLALLCNTTIAQEKKMWDYPTKPGSEKWKSFTTTQEMLDACQIPEDILQKLSSEELAELCANYPLGNHYLYSNDEQRAITAIIDSFNGLRELCKRKDGASQLINVYIGMSVHKTIGVAADTYSDVFKLGFLELLLSNGHFFKQISLSEHLILKKNVLKKYEEKVDAIEIYSMISVQRSLLLGSKVLLITENQKWSASEKEFAKSFSANFPASDASVISEMSRLMK